MAVTAFDVHLSLSAWGFAETERGDVQAGLRTFLRSQGLWGDFSDPPTEGLSVMTRVEGGSVVTVGASSLTNPANMTVQRHNVWGYAMCDADAKACMKASLCMDDNACTANDCSAKGCTAPAFADGATCSDTGLLCAAGVCK